MRRVVDIPSGRAKITFAPSGFLGFMVALRRFDAEGWPVSDKVWVRWFTRKTLPEVIASELDLPSEEAAVLAHEILISWPAEWEASGLPAKREALGEPRDPDHMTKAGLVALYGCLTAVVLFALIGIALTIWLLAT
jgi:hypothetical protein